MRRENPRALASGLSYVQVDKHGITILYHHSPVENKNDLELDFKVFFFTDSCCSDIVDDESK